MDDYLVVRQKVEANQVSPLTERPRDLSSTPCTGRPSGRSQIKVEHIVQDAVTDDGTLDWLQQDKRVRAFVEKDAGMYDAVNRGLRRSSGEWLAYLNCDEQYLPGALQAVAEFFHANPGVEIVFADTIVIDAQGGYVCDRKVLLPLRNHSTICSLGVLTAAMFFRRSVLQNHDLYFDCRWRVVGARRIQTNGQIRSEARAKTDAGVQNPPPVAAAGARALFPETAQLLDLYPWFARPAVSVRSGQADCYLEKQTLADPGLSQSFPGPKCEWRA